MAFAGAGLNSFADARDAVRATELPLSICYRCPTSHLDLARQLVPHIEPRGDAPAGEVRDLTMQELLTAALPGDMIICRNTAPLIDACLQLIRVGKPARVRGRDIGKALAATIRAVNCGSVGNFLPALEVYEAEQRERLYRMHAPHGHLAALADRVAGVIAAYESAAWHSLEHFITTITGLFSDTNGGITLSTVHRAKGLEAERVFILAPELLESCEGQERNVKYVALTRAKHLLGFVHNS